MENRCRKCLLQDYDLQAYQQKIQELIERIEPELRTEGKLYASRLAVCEECDYLQEGMCGACGCFAKLRAAVRKQICPYKKW